MCVIAEGMGCLHKLAHAPERHDTWGAWRHLLDGTVRSEVTNEAKSVSTKNPAERSAKCSKHFDINEPGA